MPFRAEAAGAGYLPAGWESSGDAKRCAGFLLWMQASALIRQADELGKSISTPSKEKWSFPFRLDSSHERQYEHDY